MSVRARILLVFGLAILGAFAAVGDLMVAFAAGGGLTGVLAIAAATTAVLWQVLIWRVAASTFGYGPRVVREAQSPSHPEVEATLSPGLFAALSRLGGEMGVDVSSLRVRLVTGTLSASPSVVEVGGGTHVLLLPVGFLLTWQRDEEAAVALLAHELAHIRQRDTRLWLFATGFLHGVERARAAMWTLTAVTAAIGLAVYVIGWIEIEPARAGLAPGYSLQRWHVEMAIVHMNTELAGVALVGPLQTLLLVVFARTIRRFRQEAEESADLAAVLFADAEGLARRLSRAEAADASVFHPDAGRRLAHIEKWRRMST